MDILDRISMLLGSREQRELTNFLGLKSVAFSEWKSGKSKSYRKYLIEIADFFNVSLDYLVYGKEKSSSKDNLSDDEQELLEYFNKLSDKSKGIVLGRAEQLAEMEKPIANEPSVIEEPEEQETIFIEFSTLRVSAGAGEPLIDDSYPDFIEVKKSELTESTNFAVKINGKSMMPKFKDGDVVLVKSQPDVNVGEIGIFIIDGNGYIKERGDDKLVSINPEYTDIYFKKGQDIRCKGLVIGVLEDDDFI